MSLIKYGNSELPHRGGSNPLAFHDYPIYAFPEAIVSVGARLQYAHCP